MALSLARGWSFVLMMLVGLPATPAGAGGVELERKSHLRELDGDSFIVANGDQQDIDSLVYTLPGPLNETFATSVSLPSGQASLDAWQTSDIAAFGVSGSGSATSSSQMFADTGFCYSVGSSKGTIEFFLPVDAPYRLVAKLVAGPTSQAKLVLSGPGGAVINLPVVGASQEVRSTGTLAAGQYTLYFSSFASTSLSDIGATSDAATFSLYFSTSGKAADLDNDGIVGAADLGSLLGSWGTCDACAADFDANGTVDGADVAVLLGSWG